MADIQKSKYSTLWIILIVLLLILGTMVFYRDVLTGSGTEPAETQPPSTEWTTKPEGGVDVTLPETPMRPVEPEGEAPAETAPAETE